MSKNIGASEIILHYNATLIGIVIALKLTGHINWSWWLITLPFWGGLVFAIIVLIVYHIVQSFK